MLSIKECKEILGNEVTNLSDEDIMQIREWHSNMADILIRAMEIRDAKNEIDN